MTDPRQDPSASPPDDGGSQGSFSRPEDQLRVNPTPDQEERPELNRDSAHGSGRGSNIAPWGIALLVVAMLIFWAYCRGMPE